MDEMRAVGILAGQVHHIVVCSGTQRSGTERQAVMWIGHGIKKRLDAGVAGNDARKAEYLQRRIVGMHAHVDAVFIAYRHDGFKEIFHILP